jgi:hypothetical protein
MLTDTDWYRPVKHSENRTVRGETGFMPRAARRQPSGLPAELTGPVTVALAKAVERLPGPHARPGGCVFEPKWGGYLY